MELKVVTRAKGEWNIRDIAEFDGYVDNRLTNVAKIYIKKCFNAFNVRKSY